MKNSGVSMHLELCHGRYYLCHSRICQALKTGIDDEEEQLKVLESVMKGKADLTPMQIQALSISRPSLRSFAWLQRWNPLQIKTTHKKFPKQREEGTEYPEVTDPILIDEVEFTQQEMDDWKAQIHNRQQRRLEREQAVKEGTTMECMCCYADCAMEEMVSCRDQGHLFCVDCLRKHTEDRVFGFTDFGGANGFEITCIHLGDCDSGFTLQNLEKALPPKVLKKYEELQASISLEKAGILGNICQCPKCDFRAEVPTSEDIFRCPLDHCKHESCRHCGKPPHGKTPCHRDEETNVRLQIEEAMTRSRLRNCNGCGKKFYKIEGCNKMTCPTCKTRMCYICRKTIDSSGYDHFCTKNRHETGKAFCCSKCPLYSKTEEDDLLAAKEAGLKEADKIIEANYAERKKCTIPMLKIQSKLGLSNDTKKAPWVS